MDNNTVTLFSLKDGKKVKVLKYMKNFFLKRGFSNKDYIHFYIIRLNFFRKLLIFFRLAQRVF